MSISVARSHAYENSLSDNLARLLIYVLMCAKVAQSVKHLFMGSQIMPFVNWNVGKLHSPR